MKDDIISRTHLRIITLLACLPLDGIAVRGILITLKLNMDYLVYVLLNAYTTSQIQN